MTKTRMKRPSHDHTGAVESGGYTTAEQRQTLQHRINLYNQRQTPAHQLKFVSVCQGNVGEGHLDRPGECGGGTFDKPVFSSVLSKATGVACGLICGTCTYM